MTNPSAFRRCLVADSGQLPEFRSLTPEEIAGARQAGRVVIVDPEDDSPDQPILGWESDAEKWFKIKNRNRSRSK